MATGIGLQSLALAAEKFPDRWMEKIPYYRSKEDKDRKKRSESRKHSRKSSRKEERRDDYYDDEYSDEYENDRNERDDRRRYRSNSVDDRRYDEDARSSRRRSYNPADYAPVDRAAYPARRSNPSVAPGASAAGSYAEPSRRTSTSGPTPGYVPYSHVYRGSPQSQYSRTPRSAYYPSANATEVSYSPTDRRAQEDRYSRDYRDEPRSGRYSGSHPEASHRNSRGYESEGDRRYSRRSSRRQYD